MHLWQYLLLFFGGLFSGIVNSVAGGGSLLVYPLLISLGLAPIHANATSSFTVWPGALSSAYGYRKHIKKLPKYYYILLLPSFVGGLIGAILLKETSNRSFKYIVPWFIILGVVLLAIQPKIHAWLYKKNDAKTIRKYRKLAIFLIALALFFVAMYGGYFGAGFGIIMLAFLGFTELTDIQEMNGLKNLAAVTINIVASLYFIIYRLVDWRYTPLLFIGSIMGGLIGSVYSANLPSNLIRKIVIVIGIIVAIVLLIKI